jgi:hypothetical protein
MSADGTEQNRLNLPLIYKGGATLGLWIAAVAGIYLGHVAESAKREVPSSAGSTKTATVDAVEVTARNKDDIYAFVSGLAPGVISALPIARPVQSDSSARQTRPQNKPVGAVATRHDPFETAGTERFDRCLPECESRDPLIAQATRTQDVYQAFETSSSASGVPTVESSILLVGRLVVSQIADAPRVVLDTGEETLESLVQLVQ